MLVMASGCAMAEEDTSIDQQVDALLARMTLDEKVGQLTQFSDIGDVTGPAPDDALQARKVELIRSGAVGSMRRTR